MIDFMLDLETMGNGDNSPIATIGLVAFDLQENDDKFIKEVLYVRVEMASQPWAVYDAGTVYFWLEQTRQGQLELIGDPLSKPRIHIGTALNEIKLFLMRHNYTVRKSRIFCYGATFDHVILKNAYRNAGVINPINYGDCLCMRTIARLSSIPCPKQATYVNHKADDDCKRQIMWLKEILSNWKLGRGFDSI